MMATPHCRAVEYVDNDDDDDDDDDNDDNDDNDDDDPNDPRFRYVLAYMHNEYLRIVPPTTVTLCETPRGVNLEFDLPSAGGGSGDTTAQHDRHVVCHDVDLDWEWAELQYAHVVPLDVVAMYIPPGRRPVPRADVPCQDDAVAVMRRMVSGEAPATPFERFVYSHSIRCNIADGISRLAQTRGGEPANLKIGVSGHPAAHAVVSTHPVAVKAHGCVFRSIYATWQGLHVTCAPLLDGAVAGPATPPRRAPRMLAPNSAPCPVDRLCRHVSTYSARPELGAASMASVRDNAWVCGEALDFIMYVQFMTAARRGPPCGLYTDDVFLFTTMFAQMIGARGPGGVVDWATFGPPGARESSLADKDFILVPANVGDSHWILYVVHQPYAGAGTPGPLLYVFDSLPSLTPYSRHKDMLDRLVAYLDAAAVKYAPELQGRTDARRGLKRATVPAQEDAINCGIFVALYANELLHSAAQRHQIVSDVAADRPVMANVTSEFAYASRQELVDQFFTP